jgi:undecaprenyl-diphosphatase
VIGTVPAVVVGLVAYDAIERVFHTISLTAAMLPVTGVFLLFTRLARDKGLRVSPLLALAIGAAQAVAIIPGVSRSGMTVGTALLLGVRKDEAVKFSFLLSLPAILGGAVLELAKAGAGPASDAASGLASTPSVTASNVSATALVIGSVTAFAFALLAARTLLGVVRKGKLEYFGYYCILAGVAFLILTWS